MRLVPAAELRPVSKITVASSFRDLSGLDELADDIRARGLQRPLTVNPSGRLVLARRRLAACRLAGLTAAPCRTVTTVAEALQVITWENEDDVETGDAKYHLPATIAALAEQDLVMRELEWWPRAAVAEPGEPDRRRIQVAGAFDGPGETGFINTSQYSKVRGIAFASQGWESPQGAKPLRVPPQVQAAAKAALQMLDHRDTRKINGVYVRWRDMQPQQHPGATPLTSRDIRPLVSTIQGFTSAIATTGAPGPQVTSGQAAELDTAVSSLITALRQYRSWHLRTQAMQQGS